MVDRQRRHAHLAAGRPRRGETGPAPRKPDAVAPPTALAEGDKPPAAQDRHHHRRLDRQAAGSHRGAARRRAAAPSRAQHKADAKPDSADRPAPARNLAPRRDPEDRPRRRAAFRDLCAPGRSRRPAAPTQPRIAIVIEGLGIGANSTSEALAKLPAPVTYAFAPYGTDLERWVARARGEGHEVLLQVGMEPFDYPDNDPGPQTLLTSISAEQNLDRLHWFLSPLPGLCRRHQPDGRALHRHRSGARAGAARDRQARADLFRQRYVAAQRRGPGLRRAERRLRQGRRGARRGAGRRPRSTARLPGSRRPRASAASRSAPRARCRSRSSASRSGSKSAEARGITLVPISAVANRAKSAS